MSGFQDAEEGVVVQPRIVVSLDEAVETRQGYSIADLVLEAIGREAQQDDS